MLSSIRFNILFGINGQLFVWIDGNQHLTDVCLWRKQERKNLNDMNINELRDLGVSSVLITKSKTNSHQRTASHRFENFNPTGELKCTTGR